VRVDQETPTELLLWWCVVQFQRMKEAYECLVDPVKRRAYDE
jgi:hypothetical protein